MMTKLTRALACAACVACPVAAYADRDDTLNFKAGVTQQHDDNLFRLPANVSPLLLVGNSARDDRVTIGTFGVDFRKTYSLQQFEAGFEHVAYRYATYAFLNHDVDNGHAAWRWQVTPRLKGNLTCNRSQALVGFGDYTNYGTKNIRTITTARLDADWNVLPGGWHLLAGVDHSSSRNTRQFTEEEGSRVASADFGVRYVFPSSNWLEFITRTGEGEFPNRSLDSINQFDTGFRDRRYEVRARWTRGKSILEGALGYMEREHDHFASRDYSGGIGSFKWTWTPTGKLALVLSWKRDLAGYTDAISSYYVRNAYSITPLWQIGAKLRLSLKLERTERDFRGPVTPLPFIARSDSNNTAQFSAEWTPWRAVTVSGYYIDDSRDSSIPGSNYRDHTLGANVLLGF